MAKIAFPRFADLWPLCLEIWPLCIAINLVTSTGTDFVSKSPFVICSSDLLKKGESVRGVNSINPPG
jgi:hypothetical protein